MDNGLHDRSTTQLLGLARDALRIVAGRHHRAAESDVSWTLGALRQVIGAVDGVLDGVGRELAAQGRTAELSIVDGPFDGEPEAATETARMWLDRARVMLTGPARAVDNAHIAASGLALCGEAPTCGRGTNRGN